MITYLDETDYLTALSGMGFGAISEGFENDAIWGTTRTGAGAASVTSQGITWESNVAPSNIRTSGGAARTGNWGVFSLPHGDFAGPDHTDDTPDGLMGASTQTLYGIGGWIRTNTPPAGISLAIDGSPVDFGDLPGGGDPTTISGPASFFGVIDTDGFSSFLWQETEGTWDDQKFIFADDFTFGIASVPSPVPEPSGIVLFAAGFFGLPSLRRLSNACNVSPQ